jgi:hypothetical protein
VVCLPGITCRVGNPDHRICFWSLVRAIIESLYDAFGFMITWEQRCMILNKKIVRETIRREKILTQRERDNEGKTSRGDVKGRFPERMFKTNAPDKRFKTECSRQDARERMSNKMIKNQMSRQDTKRGDSKNRGSETLVQQSKE